MALSEIALLADPTVQCGTQTYCYRRSQLYQTNHCSKLLVCCFALLYSDIILKVCYLNRFGSKNYKMSARIMLSTVFTDSLMQKFNWMGQRGKKRPIKDCKMVSVINGKLLRDVCSILGGNFFPHKSHFLLS